MFSDILKRFRNFCPFFSLYSVEMATSKYTKFRHASKIHIYTVYIVSYFYRPFYSVSFTRNTPKTVPGVKWELIYSRMNSKISSWNSLTWTHIDLAFLQIT